MLLMMRRCLKYTRTATRARRCAAADAPLSGLLCWRLMAAGRASLRRYRYLLLALLSSRLLCASLIWDFGTFLFETLETLSLKPWSCLGVELKTK